MKKNYTIKFNHHKFFIALITVIFFQYFLFNLYNTFFCNYKANAPTKEPPRQEFVKAEEKEENFKSTLPNPQELEIQDLLIRSCNPSENLIALTFDDGPSPTLTEKYLQILKEHDIKATFFVVGRNVKKYPEMLKKIKEQGHEIGNHTYYHSFLTRVSQARIDNEFNYSKIIIESTLGDKVELFRPPYGDYNSKIVEKAASEGLYTIMWDVDPKDWKATKKEQVVQNILNNTKRGSIILLHEGKEVTLKALPEIIEGLKAKGYKFVTVSELILSEGEKM